MDVPIADAFSLSRAHINNSAPWFASPSAISARRYWRGKPGLEGSLRIKAWHGRPGQLRPHREMSDIVIWNHDHRCIARRRIVAESVVWAGSG
jgi:hypothetical protein